jgi:hypothetical protein
MNHEWQYLPQVALKAHATILSSAARTTLTQTFANQSDQLLEEVSYKFPLYDGVSVVGFQCRIGSRVLHSEVKSKEQANADYDHALASEQSAAIMEHTTQDVGIFVIRVGNVRANEVVTVEITFIGELKQDTQTDGIRYTLPNTIAPGYSNATSIFGRPSSSFFTGIPSPQLEGISITVDVQMEKNSVIRQIHSPSHSINSFLGRTSSTPQDSSSFEPSQASATLRLAKDSQPLLERDFVLITKADGLDSPRALLETHPTLSGQRAMMASLVPKFTLPPAQPEVVFVIDRSGSMHNKISTLQSALKVFLKSLPVGVCFNICSFGTHYSFLWPTSKLYDNAGLQQALSYVNAMAADMGGTETQIAVEAAVNNRLKGRDLEVLLLTDGQIYDQEPLFKFVRNTAADNSARFFSLGLGHEAFHSLIEGVARSGNGFAQSVLNGEELDRKVVRMLKGALTPHIYDYKLQVEYDTGDSDDFEVVENTIHQIQEPQEKLENEHVRGQGPQESISLFDDNYKESDAELGDTQARANENLPKMLPPKVLQAPYNIPPLYPFIRHTVYLLLDPQSADRIPKSLTFSATSKQGPLQLRIPVSNFGQGETIHQLASRKAIIELEELHGWLEKSQDSKGNRFTQLHSSTQQRLAVRECQALGVKYQVTGKHCSFVALEEESSSGKIQKKQWMGLETENISQRTQLSEPPQQMMLFSCQSGPYIAPHARSHQPTSLFGQRGPVGGNQPSFGYCTNRGGSSSIQPSYAGATPFGNAAPSIHPSGGLFGRGQQQHAQISTGSSLFGMSSGSQGPHGPSVCPTPSLFGGGASTQPSSGLFGQSSTLFGGSASTQPSGGLFGQAVTPLGGGASTQPSRNPFGQASTPFGQAPTPIGQASALFGGSTHADTSFYQRSTGFGASQSNNPNTSTNSEDKVHRLIDLQSFRGNWELSQELCTLLGCDLTNVYNKFLNLIQANHTTTDLTNALATIMALGLLENKNTDSKSVWELVHGKAEIWLNKTLPALGVAGAILDAHKVQIKSLEFLNFPINQQ